MRARKLIKHQTWEKRGGKGEGYAVAKFSPPPLSSLYFKPVTNPSLPGYGKKNPSASIVRKRKGERIKKLHVHGPNPLPSSFRLLFSPAETSRTVPSSCIFDGPRPALTRFFLKPRERLSDLISPAALGRAPRKGGGGSFNRKTASASGVFTSEKSRTCMNSVYTYRSVHRGGKKGKVSPLRFASLVSILSPPFLPESKIMINVLGSCLPVT